MTVASVAITFIVAAALWLTYMWGYHNGSGAARRLLRAMRGDRPINPDHVIRVPKDGKTAAERGADPHP